MCHMPVSCAPDRRVQAEPPPATRSRLTLRMTLFHTAAADPGHNLFTTWSDPPCIETTALGEENALRRIQVVTVAAALFALFALSASACTFYFNYESVSAPIGTVGDIGIRVQKTHGQCTLSSMNEYQVEGKGIQILGATAWSDLGNGLYEKWVQISLSEEGAGFLMISKTCTKEGYEEKVLPITSLAPDEETAWTMAWNGQYPFATSENVVSLLDSAVVEGETLSLGDVTLTLPSGVLLPSELPSEIRVFYTATTGDPRLLLIVGDGLFVRLDHLTG